MTLAEVNNLHPGDEVYWNDPDAGICSDHYVITMIETRGEVIRIMDTKGRVLECFAKELS